MAFVSALLLNANGSVHDLARTVEGNLLVHRGTYLSNAGSVGGAINTGLDVIVEFTTQPTGAAVDANVPTCNNTFPVVNATPGANAIINLVTTANAAGIWIAKGR